MSFRTHLDDVLEDGTKIRFSTRAKGILAVIESNIALFSGAAFRTL